MAHEHTADDHAAHDHDDHDHGPAHGWRRWVYATNHKDIVAVPQSMKRLPVRGVGFRIIE